ncbi:hypothetical protein D9756_008892 [Leucocoprinus leucothites]|uniref:F-box domain-containing protein n=1 Tax=Leucocoprinus leucothites TaxID=201217 RepID=A0A8H5CYL2_9AGAR|nr:hypothetical protein D9756_008892 [Leucoagaricus leucothites]
MQLLMLFDQYAEVQELESTLHGLELEIERLVLRKTECLRRLNDLKASTAILPVEILSAIFEHACSDTKMVPLALGLVSSHWRDVSRTTPKLWTSIQLSITTETVKCPERHYNLLRLYFANARSYPLSLKLLGTGSPLTSRREPNMPRKLLLDLIFKENASRIGALTCTGISRELWDEIYQCASPMTLFPALQSLEMGWSTSVFEPAEIQIFCPNLKSATLSGHFTPVALPWKQLTRLELCGLPVDRCIELLFECPLLEEYYCDLPRWVHPAHSEFLPLFSREDINLPKLRTLGWWFMNEDWTNFLMDAHFPSLHHISSLANVSDFHRSSILPLPNYFIRNAPRLKSFEGDIRFIWRGAPPIGYTADFGDENVDEGISGVLAAAELEELSVRNLDVDDLRFIFDQLLVSHHDTYWDTLPCLQVLSIHAPNISQDLFHPPVFSSFVEFLQSRRSGRKIDQLKTYSRIDSLEPPERAHQAVMAQFHELRQLVREGLRVELVDSSGTRSRIRQAPYNPPAKLEKFCLKMSVLDRQNEVDSLNANTNQLDDEIRRLMVQRASYRHRVNGFQAATASLPPETLSNIFEYYSHSRKRLLTIGAVCSHWRDIAWSTPGLWSKCHLSFLLGKVFRWQIEVLELWFKNCQPCGLFLYLDFDHGFDDSQERFDRTSDEPLPEVATNEEILKLIFVENSENVRGLICAHDGSVYTTVPGIWWKYFINCYDSNRLFRLQRLDVELVDFDSIVPHRPVTNIQALAELRSQLPALSHLTLRFDTGLELVPLQQLTTLELWWIRSDQCLELLLRLPQLEAFSCQEPKPAPASDTSDFASVLQREDIVLPHLTRLGWVASDDEWTLFLSTHIHLPFLRHLRWSTHFHAQIHSARTFELLSRDFLRKLTSLRVFESNLPLEVWVDSESYDETSRSFVVLDRVPRLVLNNRLEELHFLEAEYGDSTFFSYLSRHLLVVPEARESTSVLPRLIRLEIELCQTRDDGDDDLYFSPSLRDFLRAIYSRPTLEVVHFRIDDVETWSSFQAELYYQYEDIQAPSRIEIRKRNGDVDTWEDLKPIQASLRE